MYEVGMVKVIDGERHEVRISIDDTMPLDAEALTVAMEAARHAWQIQTESEQAIEDHARRIGLR
jgi:hypothetical protein